MFRRDTNMIHFPRPQMPVQHVTLEGSDTLTSCDVVPCPRADWPHNCQAFWDWVRKTFN